MHASTARKHRIFLNEKVDKPNVLETEERHQRKLAIFRANNMLFWSEFFLEVFEAVAFANTVFRGSWCYQTRNSNMSEQQGNTERGLLQ